MLRTFATATFLILSLTAARADDAQPSVTVAFGDLNLTHPADAKILALRLEAAAVQVCRDAGVGLIGAPAIKEMRACTSTAANTALSRIQAAIGQAVRLHLVNDREKLASN